MERWTSKCHTVKDLGLYQWLACRDICWFQFKTELPYTLWSSMIQWWYGWFHQLHEINGKMDFKTSHSKGLRSVSMPSLQRWDMLIPVRQNFPVLSESRRLLGGQDSCVFHQLHEINGKLDFRTSHSKGLRPVSVPSLQRWDKLIPAEVRASLSFLKLEHCWYSTHEKSTAVLYMSKDSVD